MAAVQPARRAFRPARRHGADGTAEQPAVGSAGAGRHRAPADAGRHRAVTTEMPVTTAGTAAPVAPVAALVAPPVEAVTVAVAGESDVLTRRIRLDGLASHPRGGRPAVRPSV
jgi:hypothetical protein